jgi:RimJ/RimL family protein N-acetyltransferase
MHFERTNNYALIRRIMTDPAVYPAISDDSSPRAEEFHPVAHPSLWYVLAFDGGELLGMWIFSPQGGACWEVHTCLLPGHGYHRGRKAARAMAAWIWKSTPCHRIVTSVPAFNRAAVLFARAAGMRQYGVNEASFMKFGKLHDQILLGLSRPEGVCQQR